MERGEAVIYLGLETASAEVQRSRYELLAQGVSGVIPMYRDSGGGCYFAKADLAALPRRTVCAINHCGRARYGALPFCRLHHRRVLKGTDPGERIRAEKSRSVPPSGATPERVERYEEREARYAALWSGDEQIGSVRWGATWRHEDIVMQRLGTPEVWQEVADAALERAWADLLDGSYERRLRSRLAAQRPSRPAPVAIQSPILAVVS